MSDKIRLTFSRGELLEMRRALELIEQEDGAADVNMDAEAVKDKTSAKAKIAKALMVAR